MCVGAVDAACPRYQEEVEAFLLKNTSEEDFQMLMEGLPEFLKDGENDMDPRSAKTLDMLMSFGDFEAFRDMMLTAKIDREAKEQRITAADTQTEGDIMSVPEFEELLQGLAAAMRAGGSDGWRVVTDKDWYKIETKPDGEGGTVLRSAAVMDLSPSDTKRMLLSYGKAEMVRWIDMLEKTEVLKEYSPNDFVVRMTMHLTGILAVVGSGMPKTAELRIVTAADFPEKGDFSILSLPWDSQSSSPCSSSLFKVKSSCIRPVPGQPGKTLMTTVSPKPASWVPQWVMNSMYAHWGPKHVAGMVTKFKKHKSEE